MNTMYDLQLNKMSPKYNYKKVFANMFQITYILSKLVESPKKHWRFNIKSRKSGNMLVVRAVTGSPDVMPLLFSFSCFVDRWEEHFALSIFIVYFIFLSGKLQGILKYWIYY